jgi:membrane-associated phospholipid phosphatase
MKHFNSAESLTFSYIAITAIYLLLFVGQTDAHTQTYLLLLYRIVFIAALFLITFISQKYESRFTGFIRYVFPFALITYWYPDTYSLGYNVESNLPKSIVAPNLDSFFDNIDKTIFGCSPAMEFSKALPQALISEIMYFGYFAYYFIFLITFIYFYYHKPAIAERAMFYCLCSFFVFYIIFTLVPVAGPQFYYASPDNQVPDGYIFSRLMRTIQNMGEKPTGAFPSSHVGMTIIAMILLYKHARTYFYSILPIAIILVASTVYIKAHYLIDVVAAFLITPLIFLLSKSIFKLFK